MTSSAVDISRRFRFFAGREALNVSAGIKPRDLRINVPSSPRNILCVDSPNVVCSSERASIWPTLARFSSVASYYSLRNCCLINGLARICLARPIKHETLSVAGERNGSADIRAIGRAVLSRRGKIISRNSRGAFELP